MLPGHRTLWGPTRTDGMSGAAPNRFASLNGSSHFTFPLGRFHQGLRRASLVSPQQSGWCLAVGHPVTCLHAFLYRLARILVFWVIGPRSIARMASQIVLEAVLIRLESMTMSQLGEPFSLLIADLPTSAES